ncbi:MAG: haloacid dehalogenase [Crocinitomicaceae bacterium]|nr:haloacid dehalogenase [Crocinitomicaceae bacterium]|tara:strand:+ start:8920 stop:9552 length:633 start_codon:yes stop_codon:yes gene_type:complete
MINTIIFDFGGVILNINYHKTIEAFQQLGVENFDQLYSQHQQNHLFDLLETGKIEPEAFVAALKESLPESVTEQQIIDAWNALLLNYPKHRLAFLKEIGEAYPIYMLSNTNAIHEQYFIQTLAEEHPEVNLKALFKEVYYSHEVGMRKPNVEIFEWVLEQNQLNPATTLFIDDTEQHIKGAQKAGLHTYHLLPGEDIAEVLPRVLAELNQ